MFGLFRKKATQYSSTVVIYCGIGMNQFMPERLEHQVNDLAEERTSIFTNCHMHNISSSKHDVSTQNAAYINHFYKPLKRNTKIFNNNEHN